MTFLLGIGMNEFIGQNRYIIAPDDPMSRKTLYEFLTDAFTHFASKAGVDCSFKSIRKRFMTIAESKPWGKAIDMSDHSSQKVLDKHYIDFKMLAAQYCDKNFHLLS